MAFYYAQEKKKFDGQWEWLQNEYMAAGMSLEDIEAMQKFDLEAFNSNRRFFNHTQPLRTSECGEDDCGDDSKSVLLERFPETMSVTDDDSLFHSRYWWIEQLNTPELIQAAKSLSDEDKELLNLYAFDGYSQSEIAEFYGIAQKNVSKKISRIKKHLRKGV